MNNTRESSKCFFSSKVNEMGIRVIIWILEYIFLSCVYNILPQYVVATSILIGYVLIMYAIYYWVTQKHSTEYLIYILITLEFILNKLNQEQVFVDLFKCPFWVLYIALFIYFFSRIFIIEKVYHFFHDIYLGFLDSRREKLDQRIFEMQERQEVLVKEKAERAEYVKKRSLSRRQYWSNLRDKTLDFFFGIIDFFLAIPGGILTKNKKKQTIAQAKINNKIESPKGNAIRGPMWVKVVLGVIIVFFFRIIFVIAILSNFLVTNS